MRMERCNRGAWRHNAVYGLAGLMLATVQLILMRHDLGQGLSWAVVIVSAAGWTRCQRSDRRTAEASAR
jgi:hypothetical protein